MHQSFIPTPETSVEYLQQQIQEQKKGLGSKILEKITKYGPTAVIWGARGVAVAGATIFTGGIAPLIFKGLFLASMAPGIIKGFKASIETEKKLKEMGEKPSLGKKLLLYGPTLVATGLGLGMGLGFEHIVTSGVEHALGATAHSEVAKSIAETVTNTIQQHAIAQNTGHSLVGGYLSLMKYYAPYIVGLSGVTQAIGLGLKAKMMKEMGMPIDWKKEIKESAKGLGKSLLTYAGVGATAYGVGYGLTEFLQHHPIT